MSAQVTGSAPSQTPAWQVSVWEHGSVSLQAAPSVFGGSEHRPVEDSHAPTSWHWSKAVQTTAAVPSQIPPLHAEAVEHRSPSSQPMPLSLLYQTLGASAA